MANFTRRGKGWFFADGRPEDQFGKLDAGNYVISSTPDGRLFFEEVDEFVLPKKMYGEIPEQAARIMNTFTDRPHGTGVLLEGEKGSGKTLLAKLLGVQGAHSLGMPTILVNAPWGGDVFSKLMQNLDQPAMVLFDEFEKVYAKKESQAEILTLLDGVFPSKKLWVFTVNDKWGVDSHMHNRPGRLYYSLSFEGLSVRFIEEYCADMLKDRSHTEMVLKVSSLFEHFNFDMLQSLIQEMNRYGEEPLKSLEWLNIKPVGNKQDEYKVTAEAEGEEVVHVGGNDGPTYCGNPTIAKSLSVDIYTKDKNQEGVKAYGEGCTKVMGKWVRTNTIDDVKILPQHLNKLDLAKGEMCYVLEHQGHKISVMLKKEKPRKFSYRNYAF